jgi:hypothetical protein
VDSFTYAISSAAETAAVQIALDTFAFGLFGAALSKSINRLIIIIEKLLRSARAIANKISVFSLRCLPCDWLFEALVRKVHISARFSYLAPLAPSQYLKAIFSPQIIIINFRFINKNQADEVCAGNQFVGGLRGFDKRAEIADKGDNWRRLRVSGTNIRSLSRQYIESN